VSNVGALGLYYETAYAAVRAASPHCFVAISPLLWQQDGGAWQTFMAAPPYTRVLQDLHRRAAGLGHGQGQGRSLSLKQPATLRPQP
jgi:hypothetical protein